MVNNWILLVAFVILLSRARHAFEKAKVREALRDDGTGTRVTFAAADATEEFERRAIRNAKSGGGFVVRPVNRKGVIVDVNCYVENNIVKGQVAMMCQD